ncbi:hypothetical protein [Vibrio phage RYC]|nr:hypothetical protein [Vibrio phage RYC]
MLIRSSHDSTKAYKCRVYTGQIRKAANKENRQFWNKKKEQWEVPLLRPDKFHHMEKIYTKVGILQATDVTKFVKEDEFLNIQDITE